MQGSMEIRYSLDSRDLVRGMRSLLLSRSKWVLWGGTGAMAVGLLSLLMEDGRRNWSSILLFEGVAALVLLWFFGYLPTSAARQLGPGRLPMEMRWIFSEAGTMSFTSQAESKMDWSAYLSFQETTDFFVLMQTETIANLIPKRAFASPEEAAAFRSLLGSRLAQPGTVSPSSSPPVSPWLERLLGSVLILVGVGGLGMTVHDAYVAQAARSWPVVRGTIEHWEERGTDRVGYEYSVNGISYSGRFVSPGVRFEDIERRFEKYPEGTAVEAHYDPRWPSEAFLETKLLPEKSYQRGLTSLAFLLGGAFLVRRRVLPALGRMKA